MHNKSTAALLYLGHAIDHMFLLIFANDFGLTRREDLMPYSAIAFSSSASVRCRPENGEIIGDDAR
ncbi:hypothetical protein [Noviherbaspirillum aerium]|uniref:hypothetical protein n=1 Tax=Noviherbaspirillum aerium TaxID=2588497 RepID=UPI001CEFA7AC|nr:hypothetical protein [Noviherbaspirillum aerium]